MYAKLIERLPKTVYEKFGTLRTPSEKFSALAKLVNKHGGELVEPDFTRSYWRLIPACPGFARMDWGEQFVCFESGQQAPVNFTAQEHELYAKQWKPTLAGQQNLLMVCNNERTAQHGFQVEWHGGCCRQAGVQVLEGVAHR